MSSVFKLTPSVLKKLIKEEKKKLLVQGKIEAEEVDAKDYAKSLAHHIDYAKKLKLEERQLKRKVAKTYLKRHAVMSKIKENL